VWINRVLLPNRMPGVKIEATRDLQEVEAMLAERVAEWTSQWKQEGLEQGRQEGRVELLTRMLAVKFADQFNEGYHRRVAQADPETRLLWTERLPTARTIDEIFDEN
jgi:flagellar biosynthesis/type III secretory pathway protein FliH